MTSFAALFLLAEILTLGRAYDLTLARDERLRTADESVLAARRGGERVDTLLRPRAALFASGIVQNQIETDFGLAGVGQRIGVMLPSQKQILQERFVGRIGGQLEARYTPEYWKRKSLAASQLAALLARQGRTRELVMLEVATAFYDYLRGEGRAKVAGLALERAKAQRDLAVSLVTAGTQLRSAVLQAELDVSRAERQILDAEAEQSVAKEALERLTGISLSGVRGPETLTAPENIAAAVRCAETDRGDLAELRQAVTTAELDLDATRRRLWPTLGALAQAAHTAPTGLFSEAFNWSAVLTLTVPLYQGGGEYLDIKDKETQVRLAKLAIERRQKEIRDEVVRAYSAFDRARRTIELLAGQVGLARENHDLARTQFQAGTVRSTDVTLAQIELATAEDQLIVATHEREMAGVMLRAAMGRLAKGSRARDNDPPPMK